MAREEQAEALTAVRLVEHRRLHLVDEQTVTLPAMSRLLAVQRSEAERDELDLWAEVTPSSRLVRHTVWLVKVGQPVPTHPDARWLGLVQLGGGALVLHVYATTGPGDEPMRPPAVPR